MSKPLTKAQKEAAEAAYLEHGIPGKPTERDKLIAKRVETAETIAKVENYKNQAKMRDAREAAAKQRPSKARGGHVPHEMPDGRMCYACEMDGMHGYADGGFIEQAKELYDVAQNYPEEFERAYTGFKGEITKIYDFWKDLLGFRRGGHVAFKR
jgi:hypothetical protein